VALGYYFGSMYDAISNYVDNAEYFIVFAVIATLVVYYIYTKATSFAASRLVTI
jgi:membrane protein DedA with SNARE-associated domain